MKETMRKYLPIILGIFLGAVSIVMGQIPLHIAQFSGMWAIGNHTGYLLGALIIAWMYYEKWHKSFLMSFVTMTFANLTYYITIVVFYITGWGRSPFPPSPLDSLISFAIWSTIAVVVCLLAATAVWMARRAMQKWLNFGIFIVAYLGMLGVIGNFEVMSVINWYNMSTAEHIQTFNTLAFTSRIFNAGFAFILATTIFSIGLRLAIKEKRQIG